MRQKLLKLKKRNQLTWRDIYCYIQSEFQKHGTDLAFSTFLSWVQLPGRAMSCQPRLKNAKILAKIFNCTLDDIYSEDSEVGTSENLYSTTRSKGVG